MFYIKLMFWICNYYCSDVFLKNLFVLCLTSQSDSGQVMKYIYVHDCFDVCSWVQTHLVRVWECVWVHAHVRACVCVCVCGSSSGLLKACWEACHCKSGKGKSPKCTEERTHHPPLCLSVFLSPLLPPSLLFCLTLIYKSPPLQWFLQLCEILTRGVKNKKRFLNSLLLCVARCLNLLIKKQNVVTAADSKSGLQGTVKEL